MIGKSPLIFFVIVLIILSCKKDPEIVVDSQKSELIETYLDSAGLLDRVSQDTSGLYFYPITLNPSGKTQAEGSVLKFFYQMTLLNGTIVDTYDSLDADTLIVKQGVSAIYPVGFDYALGYLKEGEKWGFVLPSRIAFGDFSYSTLIPENAIIRLEIELLEIQSEEDILDNELDRINTYITSASLRDTVNNPYNQPEYLPSGMLFKRLRLGGSRRPGPDSLITITYEGRFFDESVFDRVTNTDPFEFYFGQSQVISGLELGIAEMALQESALLVIPSYLAYRESAQVLPPFLTEDMINLEIIPSYSGKVGPYQPLIFEIQLIGVN